MTVVEDDLKASFYQVLLSRPVHYRKHNGLLACSRKTTSGYDRKWRSLFDDLNLPLQLKKRGWIKINNNSARNNSIKMELIIFVSLYQAKEVLYFYTYLFFIEELSIYVPGRAELRSFYIKKSSAAKDLEVSRRSFGVFTTLPFQLLGLIRLAVLPLDGFAGYASALEISSGLRGHPPSFYPLSVVRLISWRLRRP